MSISIYYSAKRASPLTDQEKVTIQRILGEHSVDALLEKYLSTAEGLNWESFCLYDKPSNGCILEGATKLPDNTEDATWLGVQHWCKALTALRRAIKGADWSVQVEDHELQWSALWRRYDPRK
jgi:hypothetical protein